MSEKKMIQIDQNSPKWSGVKVKAIFFIYLPFLSDNLKS